MSQEIQFDYIYEETDLSYLKQPNEVYQIKHSDYYVYHTDGKSHFRRIFYGVQFSEFEYNKMKELQEEIKNQNIKLTDDWDDIMTLKYCYSGGFEVKKSIENLKQHLEWKKNPKYQNLNIQALKILEKGIFYHLGRDKQFRPIIVLNLYMVNPQQVLFISQKNQNNQIKKINLEVYLSAICNLLLRVAKVEFVKGYVESWTVILETNGKGIVDLELGTISKIVQIMAKNFTSTLEKMFIMNPSFIFSNFWPVIRSSIKQLFYQLQKKKKIEIIHPETAAKIHLFKKNEFNKLLQFINPDQLEEKYGGTIKNIEKYWLFLFYKYKHKNNEQIKKKGPPINTFNNRKMTGQQTESNNTSFCSIENNSQKFFDKDNQNYSNVDENTDLKSMNSANKGNQISYSKPVQQACCQKCNIY
ncbi:hypothetical protein IMG5_076180 [Ichthyophthirius multifiliis]|uniref:CRAL-TRIO domain-containing protein n=1 Tax=Ichthyophthirius multifiliis TaxID=5932 RepID=G0QQ87_ICHMU|nr:hypothetical protein IMG5_076180 [Ichthyophthirius multifiliis]EGR32588.1 hypothetical protein IMG5_076180 [Ichthyophthirius multifiliis]|eukprot:XP_004036574.1 hypothetical protein IMG5_076180 [Ichthyophthirius multifiliis]